MRRSITRRRGSNPTARPVGLGTAGVAVLLLCLAWVLLGAGCAGTAPKSYSDEPGVPVKVDLASGEGFSGTLVGVEAGALVIDHSVPKSQYVTVVRKDGEDVVYLHGTPIGTAVEIREVDIVVRERFGFFEIDDVTVTTRAYFGWGTAIAAALAFWLVQLLEDA